MKLNKLETKQTTTIAVKINTYQYLKSKRQHPRESFDEVLKRILKLQSMEAEK